MSSSCSSGKGRGRGDVHTSAHGHDCSNSNYGNGSSYRRGRGRGRGGSGGRGRVSSMTAPRVPANRPEQRALVDAISQGKVRGLHGPTRGGGRSAQGQGGDPQARGGNVGGAFSGRGRGGIPQDPSGSGQVTSTHAAGIPVGKRQKPGQGQRKRQRGRAARGQSWRSQKGGNVRGSSGAPDASTGAGASAGLNPQSPGTVSLPAPAFLNGGATGAPVPLQVADGSAICYREVLKDPSSDELELPDFQSFDEIAYFYSSERKREVKLAQRKALQFSWKKVESKRRTRERFLRKRLVSWKSHGNTALAPTQFAHHMATLEAELELLGQPLLQGSSPLSSNSNATVLPVVAPPATATCTSQEVTKAAPTALLHQAIGMVMQQQQEPLATASGFALSTPSKSVEEICMEVDECIEESGADAQALGTAGMGSHATEPKVV